MSLFTPDSIERVREGADIVEVVSVHTDLRRQGERFVGLCPFHDERTPSFGVTPRDGLYHCFGCQAGGDTIRFVQEKEGLSFPDAVEALAERYGIELERQEEDPKAEEARRRRGRLGEALERVAAFYESFIWGHDEAAKARAYLTGERGLGEEVLRAFGVGFAPSGWDSVLTRGQRAGFSIEELHAAGLVQRSQNRPGSHYDRFRGRITFPVRDHRGRVVGFGARGMGPDAKPKYLNSPESEMYRKSRTLYGIDRARGPIARGARAVVVEGYTDVLALHQAGIEEAVAVMGTAITPEQLGLLASYAEEVVLALDADRAGREAMLRAQKVAGSGKLRLLVAPMPAGQDPAEMMMSEEGSTGLRQALAAAVELSEFHVRSILDGGDLSTPLGRDRTLDDVAPVLAEIGGSITGDAMMRVVSDRLDFPPNLVAERVKDAPPPPAAPTAREAEAPARRPARRREATREEQLQYKMLALCMKAPGLAQPYLDRLSDGHFTSPLLKRMFVWLRGHLAAPLEGLENDDPQLREAISRLESVETEPATAETLEFRWQTLEEDSKRRELRSAEAEGDAKRAVQLQRELGKLRDAIASR